ncbi:RNA-directed DNA polymerase, eukaryota, reverse transcriptase zinc-binding domain protein [Tanacetum coccineum]
MTRRSSQRQVRVPIKFNDHVVEKLSQKKNDTSFVGFVEDIRVSMGIDDVQIRENRSEMNEGMMESNSVARKVQTPPIKDKQANKMTYASIVNNKLDKEDNKLTFKATVINNDGNEFVIFDEELVQKGSSKWRLTICGYFVGCNMSSNELNYHLRRMWSKFGIQDVKVNSNGNCFFKIRTEEGMNEYRDKDNVVKGSKTVNVEYMWKADICPHCSVFGHTINKCTKRERERTEDEIADMKKSKEMKEDANEGNDKAWTLHANVFNAMKKYANKYDVLNEMDMEEKTELNILKDRIIFKNKWEEDRRKEQNDLDEVIETENRDANSWMANELNEGDATWSREETVMERVKKLLKQSSMTILGCSVDFINCTNSIEVEDIGSSGLFFTWIKSPLKASASIMKKLDRIMVNEGFMRKFEAVGGFFMPFLTSNHSASVLTVPNSVPKKTKSFRFTNYITDKPEFILVVEEGWKTEVRECHMFRVVKKLKALKKPINRLNRKNGNIFVKVEKLREDLKQAQVNIEKNPQCSKTKALEAQCLIKYLEAIADKEKLLFQKAKVEWLQNGDKNCKFFHKVIQSRRNLNRITGICNDEGIRFEGNNVVDQFVKHFREFLGPVEMVDAMVDVDKLLKGYNCKNGARRCALKVDIVKAYDTVDWSFLENALSQFDFHEKMAREMVTCVSSASITLNINGDCHGYFKSGRGLKQGDLISPYLFTLIMEVFSFMMARNVQRSTSFKYHKGCKDLKLTHLSFTDDLLVLSHGDCNSVEVIRDTLMEFSKAFGLKPNMGKSTIFFGSVNEGEKQRILNILPF